LLADLRMTPVPVFDAKPLPQVARELSVPGLATHLVELRVAKQRLHQHFETLAKGRVPEVVEPGLVASGAQQRLDVERGHLRSGRRHAGQAR
jgi:hypothetical protein